ncbi:hypothetical protein TNCV_2051591 [Trichonephila clavipes]|nr:hypothetical protein TNCV_2051591 [Trichonephila clavipes]
MTAFTLISPSLNRELTYHVLACFSTHLTTYRRNASSGTASIIPDSQLHFQVLETAMTPHSSPSDSSTIPWTLNFSLYVFSYQPT